MSLGHAGTSNLQFKTTYTELHTDASQWGFGAVLLQTDDNDGNRLHPIGYMSKKTSEAQQKFHSYELEVLVIVEALKKFRVYLLGLHFKIVTDCAAFNKTLEKKRARYPSGKMGAINYRV